MTGRVSGELRNPVRQDPMFVCHCAVVTDQDVLESLANGSRCLADVCRDTGAGRTCGGCVATLRTLVGRPAAVLPTRVEMSRATG